MAKEEMNQEVEQNENQEVLAQEEGEKPETKPERQKAKYSDDDLDRIINAKVAKIMAKQEKELSEAKKLAEMDAQQKAEYERDQLKAQIEALEKEKNRSEMMTVARKMLSEKEIHLGEELLSMLVTEEADSTKQQVESFIELFQSAVDEAVTDKLKRKSPSKMTGQSKLTKNEILGIKDVDKRRKVISENLNLFE